MKMNLFDTITLDDGAKVRFTGDGYLVAAPRVARTGIQLYSGSEVGKPEMKVVRVFRPEAEVFDKDSLHSYAHKPFTNDHPSEPVNADNWKDFAVGDLGGDVAKDGEFVRVPLVMMDAQAINDYRDGKRELSLGYTCDFRWEPGTAPNGEQYDAVQSTIRANHLALVKRARGGSSLRVGDANFTERNEPMTTNTNGATAVVMCDGVALNVDAVSAAVISAHIKRLEQSAASLQSKIDENDNKTKKDAADHATVLTEKQTALDKSVAEVATLKKQIEDSAMTPAKIDALVIDRGAVIAGGKKVLGDKLVIDSKSNGEIRRQVVDHVMKDGAKGWSDDAVTASFNTIVMSAKDTADGGSSSHQQRPGFGSGGTSFDDVRKGFRFDHQQTVNDADKSYNDMSKDLSDAWKGPKAA